ncbi:ribonuclease [Streptomyces sp. VRA16 Mangrove soil]|uniref:ribonuclease n=1 Tax=Streptomyces sp. VRA16 Mangrove soil TaxID=2817434 RepID=UPI001A9EF0D5|nr:ribonuclease [Streptomyces sp. VRA16 Mangrove soil]MBO1331260.1 ribonuclease [Streptomyces sp. VRA16 Mangrove soil]
MRGMKTPSRFISAAAVAAALLIGGSATVTAEAATAPAAASVTSVSPLAAAASFGDICYSDLPSQAYDTLDLMASGGPYPYAQDGTVFKNAEGLLPAKASGYYHEFTVITPGSSTRGARRVVAGGTVSDHVEDYYTSDHYASFDLIDYSC